MVAAFLPSVPLALSCTSWPPQKCTSPLRRERVSTHHAAQMTSSSSSNPAPEGPVITKALEITFRTVWVNLMTSGISPQYEQAIQSFILAAIAAYKAGYSLTALKFELANNEIKGEYMGRDMSLNDSEKETRLIWIMLVYMTLRFRGFPSERRPPDVGEEVQGRLKEMAVGLRKLVEDICEAEGKGFSLEGLKMERALGGGESGLTPAQASVRSQWSRIVFSTLKLLPGRSP